MNMECTSESRPLGFPLPPELVSAIVAHFDKDGDTLRSTALVNKDWRYPSQYHLFYSIGIRGDLTHKLEGFFRDVSTQATTLIRNVSLQGHPYKRGPYHETLDVAQLVPLLERLSSLRTLSLDSCILTLTNEFANRTSSITPFPILSLSHIIGSSLAFNALFGSLPVYDAIHLARISVTMAAATSSIPPQFSFHDRIRDVKTVSDIPGDFFSLDGDYHHTLSFCRSLLSVPHALASLTVGPLAFRSPLPGSYEVAKHFVMGRGQHLTSLNLRLGTATSTRNFKDWNLIVHCPSLQILRITLFLDFKITSISPEMDSTISLVSNAPQTLRKLEIVIDLLRRPVNETAPRFLGLVELDQSLARLTYLETFQISSTGFFRGRQNRGTDPLLDVGLREYVSQSMPETSSRGILQFG